jgi:hypothetical protein
MLLAARVAWQVARPHVSLQEAERVYAERVGEEGPFEPDELTEVQGELRRERIQSALDEHYARMRVVLEQADVRWTEADAPTCSEVLPTVAMDHVRVEGLSTVPEATLRRWLAADADGAGNLALNEAGELNGAAVSQLLAALYDAGMLSNEVTQRYEPREGGESTLRIVVREGSLHHLEALGATLTLPDGSLESLESTAAPVVGAVFARTEVRRWLRDVTAQAATRLGVDADALTVHTQTTVSRDSRVSLEVTIARTSPAEG